MVRAGHSTHGPGPGMGEFQEKFHFISFKKKYRTISSDLALLNVSRIYTGSTFSVALAI